MQLMVVRTKEEAREIFSRELNAELDQRSVPRRGRAEWLRKQLRKPDGSYLVSRESCRKWLSSEDMPDQANMSVLVGTLRLDEHKLRTGQWSRPPAMDERLETLNERWTYLPQETQEAIMAVLRAAPQPQPKAQRRRE